MADEAPIIIVGAGPVGMLLAYQLDRMNIPCVIAEQNPDTTKWPKMDLTNCRSMELLRYLGLADDYRAQPGTVPDDTGFDTLFVTNLNQTGRLLSSWRLPSVREQQAEIRDNNDGSQPAEAEQRCSQIVFEAWLKKVILAKKNIISRFGWKYLSHVEDDTGVVASFVDIHGNHHSIRARYLVGCDGGGSRVRRTAGIQMIGGPMPIQFHLVHFKSKQLANELPFGRFWHLFSCLSGGLIIDQDHHDTFTAHLPSHRLGPDTTDPREIVYRFLGTMEKKDQVKIDQVLVHSQWTPNFSVAERYHTDGLRVFLAGDAAHRNPPHGGYGMNSGVVDAIDLSWLLAAQIKGYGGSLLLSSYNLERRPMMIRALVRSHRHLLEHIKLAQTLGPQPDLLESDSAKGKDLRDKVDDFIQKSEPETRDRGIELDLRHYHSLIVYQDQSVEPPWEVRKYMPSTRPGSRAPHVFLKDQKTSIYDLFGEEFTLIQFVDSASSTFDQENQDPNPNNHGRSDGRDVSDILLATASSRGIPLKRVDIQDEPHAHKIWERDLVLVRPDTHVAWRANVSDAASLTSDDAHGIWDVVTGHTASPHADPSPPAYIENERVYGKIVREFLGSEKDVQQVGV